MPKKVTPVSQLRVLDLTMFWSGPTCTCLLGEMGMEVIKIEACNHPDPDRIVFMGLNYLNNDPGEDPWNRGMWHLRRNRNKLGITLNLETTEGKNIFLELVSKSDIVIENFRTGVLERLGIGYEELKKKNPKIILVSLSSQGDTGPEREYGSNAEVLEFTSGIRSITGYPDEVSGFTATTLADPMVGTIAAGFVVAALHERERSGEGSHVVISQRELLTSMIGEEIMDYFMNVRVTQVQGNSHPVFAPHGCYPCKGHDSWIALVIKEDSEWQNLCGLMEKPELVRDPDYADGLSRLRNRDAIDTIVSQWTIRYDRHDLMDLLQNKGIAAGAVYQPPDLIEDEHLRYRGFWDTIDDSRPGYGTYMIHGRGFYLSGTPVKTRYRAPDLGEHNHYVYGKILGIFPKRIRELENNGIIGSVPLPEIQATIPAVRTKKKAKERRHTEIL